MTKRKFYAGRMVSENQPEDMRFVIAFANKSSRDNWVKENPLNAPLVYNHPEVVLHEKIRAERRAQAINMKPYMKKHRFNELAYGSAYETKNIAGAVWIEA